MASLSRAFLTDMSISAFSVPMASRSRSSLPSRALMALAALSLTFALAACNMQTKRFDSETWKAQRGAEVTANKRNNMVSALEATVHVGMSRDEVSHLLGEPDSRDAATETDVYELGVSWLGFDEEYYEVRYQEGKVLSLRWMRR